MQWNHQSSASLHESQKRSQPRCAPCTSGSGCLLQVYFAPPAKRRKALKHRLNPSVLINCLEKVLWWRFTLPGKGQWENHSVLTCCSNKTAGFLGFKEVMGKCYLSSASLKTKYYCKPEQSKRWLLNCCMWQSRSCCNYLSLESILY